MSLLEQLNMRALSNPPPQEKRRKKTLWAPKQLSPPSPLPYMGGESRDDASPFTFPPSGGTARALMGIALPVRATPDTGVVGPAPCTW